MTAPLTDSLAPTRVDPGPDDLMELLLALPVQERLRALDEAATADALSKGNDNTEDAYARDWADWERFTAAFGLQPTDISSGLLYTFVTMLEDQGYAHKTVDRKLAATVVGLRRHGVMIPAKGGVAGKARDEVRDFAVRLRVANETRGRGKATPIQAAHVRTICRQLRDDDIYPIRDKAVLLIGLHIAARRSELASLLVTDIRPDKYGHGLEVHIRASKGGRERTVPIKRSANPLVCPVLAWERWLVASGITSGAAFRRIHWRTRQVQAGHVTGKTIGNIITDLSALVDAELHLTGHSLRSGLITVLFEHGHSRENIARLSGHSPSSAVLDGYNQPVDRWNNPVLDVEL